MRDTIIPGPPLPPIVARLGNIVCLPRFVDIESDRNGQKWVRIWLSSHVSGTKGVGSDAGCAVSGSDVFVHPSRGYLFIPGRGAIAWEASVSCSTYDEVGGKYQIMFMPTGWLSLPDVLCPEALDPWVDNPDGWGLAVLS